MKYLAIDLGDKRTGVAVGDDDTSVVSPLTVIEASDVDERWRRVRTVVEEHAPDALVVGLPLNMDGSDGPRAKSARAFANELHDLTGLPVHLTDERLTTFAADHQMARTGLTHAQKKRHRAALAAGQILQDFLHTRAQQ